VLHFHFVFSHNFLFVCYIVNISNFYSCIIVSIQHTHNILAFQASESDSESNDETSRDKCELMDDEAVDDDDNVIEEQQQSDEITGMMKWCFFTLGGHLGM
jgi:hypothetical protein